jgi:glycosyltransferase involved in cell wall biosynthesis
MAPDAASPDVSVVVATHGRADRLERLLAGLRAQTLPRERFEAIVVDDGSRDRTPSVLAAESERAELALRTIRHPRNAGRAAAREDGWRAARADLVAFIDDDCVPARDWLEAGIEASSGAGGSIVQGRTEPDPAERDRLGPFSRTITVTAYDPAFQTCNIFYPRAILERVGGFDVAAFGRVHGGEDSDLAWRAIDAGADAVFSPRPLVHHAVHRLGPAGNLRLCAGWSLLAYARHPELRRAHFTAGVFWKPTHLWLARALVALALPRRLWPLRALLALTYARSLYARGRIEGGGPLLAPYFVACDLAEMSAAARSAIRYRTPMI